MKFTGEEGYKACSDYLLVGGVRIPAAGMKPVQFFYGSDPCFRLGAVGADPEAIRQDGFSAVIKDHDLPGKDVLFPKPARVHVDGKLHAARDRERP